MLDIISQIAITILSVSAIFLIAKKNKWGFVVGLISQPFWLITSTQHEQWGVFITSIIFTINWIYGIYNWFYKKTMKNISADEAHKLIEENSDIVILDVRTPQEFEKGNIDRSVNIDFYSENFREELNKLDKNETYLIYCRSGYRSSEALNIMKDLGFKKLLNMEGGIISWQRNNYTIIK